LRRTNVILDGGKSSDQNLVIIELIVKELMNLNVFSIDCDATVKEAANKMAEQEIGSLVVTEENKPVGILTERDLQTRVVATGRRPENTKVKAIMSSPLICGEPGMEIKEAARFMIDRRIKKLPVAHQGRLIGFFTLTDLCAVQPNLDELLEEEITQKLPRRFMKRLAKKYYRT
jgi:signal-transduction protein with cAMP-binding, CBS, and nucleotidyltransferase domain